MSAIPGHMIEAADEEDAALAAEPAKTEKPIPPHKTKAVRVALRHAARKDPPRDVVKPLGRGAFLIWVVILLGLVWAAGGPRSLIKQPPWTKPAWERSQTFIEKTYQGLTATPKTQKRTLKELSRSPRKFATVISAAFLAVTGVFAAYYAAIHLVGVNLVKTTVVVYRHALRPAGKAIGKAMARARARRRARALAAGAEPKA